MQISKEDIWKAHIDSQVFLNFAAFTYPDRPAIVSMAYSQGVLDALDAVLGKDAVREIVKSVTPQFIQSRVNALPPDVTEKLMRTVDWTATGRVVDLMGMQKKAMNMLPADLRKAIDERMKP